MNHVSAHSRPVGRFRGLYCCIAAFRINAFCFFMLQYLKWPLGKKYWRATILLVRVSSSYNTSLIVTNNSNIRTEIFFLKKWQPLVSLIFSMELKHSRSIRSWMTVATQKHLTLLGGYKLPRLSFHHQYGHIKRRHTQAIFHFCWKCCRKSTAPAGLAREIWSIWLALHWDLMMITLWYGMNIIEEKKKKKKKDGSDIKSQHLLVTTRKLFVECDIQSWDQEEMFLFVCLFYLLCFGSF